MKVQSEIKFGRILVHAEITGEDGSTHEVNYAYPLGTSAEFIKEELDAAEALYNEEMKAKEENKEAEADLENAQSTVEALNKL